MEQEAQDRLAPELEKLSKLLVAIEEAMRAFGQKGWFNKMIGGPRPPRSSGTSTPRSNASSRRSTASSRRSTASWTP
jgi:hypothetical protein